MAVGFGTAKSATPATGSSFTSSSWSISGSQLAILISVAMDVGGASVTSVSWSLGGGTPYLVKRVAVAGTGSGSGFNVISEIWAIPAPTSGSGTYSVSLSTSPAYQISADYFTGTDQTTPAVVADAMTYSNTDYSGSGAITFNPSNVTASTDAVYATMAHVFTADSNSWTTGVNDFEDKTTTCNMTCAHNLTGTTCVAAALINSPVGAVISGVGVRVQAPAGAVAASPTFEPHRMPLGV